MKPKLYLIPAILLYLSFPSFAQSVFPNEWSGIWKGDMKIYTGGEIKQTIPVIFTVKETDETNTWTWKTEYLAKDTIVKDYLLKIKDQDKNQYQIDEQDGIVIDAYLFGNKLYTFFKVNQHYISGYYELRDKQLIFEIISGKEGNHVKDDIYNFSVNTLQTMILYKQE